MQIWWTGKTEFAESSFKCLVSIEPPHVCDYTSATFVHLFFVFFLGIDLLLNQHESACQKAQH